MNKFMVSLCLLLFVSNSIGAPLVINCHGEHVKGDFTFDKYISLSLPKDTNSEFLTTLGNEGYRTIEGFGTVGIGEIEVTEGAGRSNPNYSHRHSFVATILPSNKQGELEGRLEGFYLFNGTVNVIRVNYHDEEKPFVYFDSLQREITNGFCS